MKTHFEMAKEAGLRDSVNLERFADLIRADEREACAKLAEEYMRESEGVSFGVGAAIRARGQHDSL